MENINALEVDMNNLGSLEAMRIDAQIYKAPIASKCRALQMGSPLTLIDNYKAE